MALTFTGNVEDDLNTVREILSGMPHGAQQRARRIYERIGKLVEEATKENPKDPAIGVGLLYGVMYCYDHMIQDNKSVIQLLS